MHRLIKVLDIRLNKCRRNYHSNEEQEIRVNTCCKHTCIFPCVYIHYHYYYYYYFARESKQWTSDHILILEVSTIKRESNNKILEGVQHASIFYIAEYNKIQMVYSIQEGSSCISSAMTIQFSNENTQRKSILSGELYQI